MADFNPPPGPRSAGGQAGHRGNRGGSGQWRGGRGRGRGTQAVRDFEASDSKGQGPGQEPFDLTKVPHRSKSPAIEGVTRVPMTKPDAETDVHVFYPPSGQYVERQDLPDRIGDRAKTSLVCTHCLQPYTAPGHLDTRLCERDCGSCHTKGHQGSYCPRRYLSWEFYKAQCARQPYVDEQIKIRPSPDQVAKLIERGYTEFAGHIPLIEIMLAKRAHTGQTPSQNANVVKHTHEGQISTQNANMTKRKLEDMQEIANDEKEAKRQKVMSESAYLVQTWRHKLADSQAKIRNLEATLEQKNNDILRLKAALAEAKAAKKTD